MDLSDLTAALDVVKEELRKEFVANFEFSSLNSRVEKSEADCEELFEDMESLKKKIRDV